MSELGQLVVTLIAFGVVWTAWLTLSWALAIRERNTEARRNDSH